MAVQRAPRARRLRGGLRHRATDPDDLLGTRVRRCTSPPSSRRPTKPASPCSASRQTARNCVARARLPPHPQRSGSCSTGLARATVCPHSRYGAWRTRLGRWRCTRTRSRSLCIGSCSPSPGLCIGCSSCKPKLPTLGEEGPQFATNISPRCSKSAPCTMYIVLLRPCCTTKYKFKT